MRARTAKKKPYANKFVYLFELDSVRKTNWEIVAGQKALFNEIAINGNSVVLTYNQLVDSRAFFSLLSDNAYYTNFIKLFEMGKIRVSQFGDIRTISQYLLYATENDKRFLYSALPIKFCQKRLTALIRRSLMYSDLSEICGYRDGGGRKQEELDDLFVEVVPKVPGVGKEEQFTEQKSTLSLADKKSIMDRLYGLISTVLRLSAEHDIYLPPRDPKEYANLKLHNLLDVVITFEKSGDARWASAIEIIRNLSCLKNRDDDRSVYLKELKGLSNGSEDRERYQYAEAIVNLCYNYACEISICNISKHYDFSELSEGKTQKPTFQLDFFSRLEQDWRHGIDAEERYLREETNLVEMFQEDSQVNKMPKLSQAIRIAQYDEVGDMGTSDMSVVPLYESKLKEQRRKHKCRIGLTIAKKMIWAITCFLLVSMMAALSSKYQDAATCSLTKLLSSVAVGKFLAMAMSITICLILSELITTWLSKCFPGIIPLGRALSAIVGLCVDATRVFACRGEGSYLNRGLQNPDKEEPASGKKPIDYIVPAALKEYAKWQAKDPARFSPSEVYPIAALDRAEVSKDLMPRLIRQEELFGYRFGVIYKSKYNMLLVDPVWSKDGKPHPFFSYERIIPASNPGVVMVTHCNGKFVLLEQYRHALRRVQIGFPRGWAEVGLEPVNNAAKELKEELNAELARPPVCIGCIAPDSGLSGTIAHVYDVELDVYEPSVGHEGICGVVEILFGEFLSWLHNGGTDDGFTLGAYSLFLKSRTDVDA